jgi:hypothetical protein
MRGKGFNYDTGFMPGNRSRPDFDAAVVAAEIRVIARELGRTAVRITGADPEGLDLAFWFTFAGYHLPTSPDPHLDADLASYGLVSLLPEGAGSGYQDLGWRPRPAFETMAAL